MPEPPISQPGPVFTVIEYTSLYAPHRMTVPIRGPYIAPSVGAPLGSVPRWSDDTDLDLEVMIMALITDLLPMHVSSTVFTGITVFTQATPQSAPVPRASSSISEAGTSLSTAWAKAVESVGTWRADNFSLFKIILLDAPSGNNFDRDIDLTGDPMLAVSAEVTSIDNAWSSRKGGRPDQFLQFTRTLNEKLRKSYRMT